MRTVELADFRAFASAVRRSRRLQALLLALPVALALLAVLVMAVAPLAFIAAINPSLNVATVTAIIVLLLPTLNHGNPLDSAIDRALEVAVGAITDVIKDVFKDTGYTAQDLDWFVPHQANKRIIDGAAHKLGIAPEKVVMTLDRHGNTSAASIPLALDESVRAGKIKRGDTVMLEGVGGGFTWGAALLDY